jgi:hypothetical protein
MAEQAGEARDLEGRCSVNISGALRVAARGSAVPVSRGIGSANGNRTCYEPVQSSSVRSICLSLRSAEFTALMRTAL